MGKIQIPSKSNNENIDQENHRIHQLQEERQNLIEAIFYQDSIDKLLQKWQDIIKKIAFDAISKKKKKFNGYLIGIFTLKLILITINAQGFDTKILLQQLI
ncbi:hypothetical protein RirG_158750 [Rhizophagus irregularis DAOM 197198w]|nr:hypothetical protein RirG_158750 [Rhizophagus irregularis DAOM 197198w]